MKRKRFSEEQIIGILNEAEQTGHIREVCRAHNITETTFSATSGLVAGQDGSITDGLTAGAYLNVSYAMNPGKTVYDLIAALLDGDLRIGIRKDEFNAGCGATYINEPTMTDLVIPKPSTSVLLGG